MLFDWVRHISQIEGLVCKLHFYRAMKEASRSLHFTAVLSLAMVITACGDDLTHSLPADGSQDKPNASTSSQLDENPEYDSFINAPNDSTGNTDWVRLAAQLPAYNLTRATLQWRRGKRKNDYQNFSKFLDATKSSDLNLGFILFSPKLLKKDGMYPYDRDYGKWVSYLTTLSKTYPNLRRIILDDFFDGDANLKFYKLSFIQSTCQQIKGVMKLQPVIYCGKSGSDSDTKAYSKSKDRAVILADLMARPELDGCFDSGLVYNWTNAEVDSNRFQECLDAFSSRSLSVVQGVYISNTSSNNLSLDKREENFEFARQFRTQGLQLFSLPIEAGQGAYATESVTLTNSLKDYLAPFLSVSGSFYSSP